MNELLAIIIIVLVCCAMFFAWLVSMATCPDRMIDLISGSTSGPPQGSSSTSSSATASKEAIADHYAVSPPANCTLINIETSNNNSSSIFTGEEPTDATSLLFSTESVVGVDFTHRGGGGVRRHNQHHHHRSATHGSGCCSSSSHDHLTKKLNGCGCGGGVDGKKRSGTATRGHFLLTNEGGLSSSASDLFSLPHHKKLSVVPEQDEQLAIAVKMSLTQSQHQLLAPALPPVTAVCPSCTVADTVVSGSLQQCRRSSASMVRDCMQCHPLLLGSSSSPDVFGAM